MVEAHGFIRRQAANLVSILGVLPIGLLVLDSGRDYLIPLILYNNIMDDLDGILAVKLGTTSPFGARLDNVCDAVAHTAFVMVVGMPGGGISSAASLAAVAAIILRCVSRLGPGTVTAQGSPTNELIRHILFILLLTNIGGVSATPFLTVAFLFHAVSMLVTYRMPLLVRSVKKVSCYVFLFRQGAESGILAVERTGRVGAEEGGRDGDVFVVDDRVVERYVVAVDLPAPGRIATRVAVDDEVVTLRITRSSSDSGAIQCLVVGQRRLQSHDRIGLLVAPGAYADFDEPHRRLAGRRAHVHEGHAGAHVGPVVPLESLFVAELKLKARIATDFSRQRLRRLGHRRGCLGRLCQGRSFRRRHVATPVT